MSQRSITTTTSFIISSEESLDKREPSSRSTDSSYNHLTSNSTPKQHSASLNTISDCKEMNDMALNQHLRVPPKLTPMANIQPPPPPYSDQTTIYGQIPSGNNMGTLYVPNGTQQQAQFVMDNNYIESNELNVTNSASIYAAQRASLSPPGYEAGIELSHPYQLTDDRLRATAVGVAQPTSCLVNQQVGNLNLTNPNIYMRENGNDSPQSVNSSLNSCKHSPKAKRTSISSSESNSDALMPINVKSMLLHGVDDTEVIRSWLKSIKCEDFVRNFIDNGYDMSILARMTPQDLTAIGCKSPSLRKKLLTEIKRLNLEDDIPDYKPTSLNEWLDLLKLSQYLVKLCNEGYNTIDKVCELTWEDFEEIGIYKLGHQKRLLIGIDRIKKLDKEKDEIVDSIYDVHPNHRVSLNPNISETRIGTINRSTIRSGFFQTRNGANLDHRGLPVAVAAPALKHLNQSIANLDISQKPNESLASNCAKNGIINNHNNTTHPNSEQLSNRALHMDNLPGTMRRNPPLPPVRTNSLKVPDNDSNSIYGNYCGVGNSNLNATMTMSSTSFLRTPKLGTLTATTNKMLTHGGHIKSVINNQLVARSLVPVREVPLPPLPPTQPPLAPASIQGPIVSASFSNQVIKPSLIGHQLASADEFPPPPPAQ